MLSFVLFDIFTRHVPIYNVFCYRCQCQHVYFIFETKVYICLLLNVEWARQSHTVILIIHFIIIYFHLENHLCIHVLISLRT